MAESIEKHAKTEGFISFAGNWGVPTMWAHYANNHKGVCYRFDVSRQKLCKINYVSKLRSFDKKALSENTTNKLEAKYASETKSLHWEYEEEWRQYVSLNDEEIKEKATGKDLFFLDFNENLVLREVIIGAKSKIESSDIKNVLCSSGDVKIHTARPSFREYKMVPQGNKALQK